MAIEIPDRPGGMESILAILEPNAITVEYMYAFTLKRGNNAVMIVRVDKPEQASKALRKNGLSILDVTAFFTLL
jgi:hypothetical protein